ncbi:LuxR C-terminal-related transcriptional regulator [Jiangella mangrovi]|uniref:LuxR family maltose regulon positive regulatory protein n=1 Tax=Jiangella mangrovi TaxID=1524084 RepID=A0A7W9GSM9_9ACTN|nr:LuxR family maltose regulon positive regulatory protein [Jiangella mangrovi]
MAVTTAHAGRARVLEQKLRVPRMPASVVPRTRLLRDLEAAEAEGRALTLVSAPAGAGKTMLLAQWWRRLRPAGIPAAWLALDDHDDDPFVLWSGLLRACGRAVRGIDPAAEVRLAALTPPADAGNRGFLTAFAEAVDALDGPLWVLLDDVHVITSPRGVACLAGLIRYRPAGLRIMLGSRFDPPLPVARMVLDDQATEVRASDLAFDRAEADQLLRRRQIRLDEPDLSLLLERTEGWAAGLCMAALSLSSQVDRSKYIAGFAGDERPVADYLVAEVLDTLSEDTVELLLATAVAETLTSDLASRLAGRADAGAVLARLARDNALVSRVGRAPTSYRVHGLLRSFLLAEATRRDVEGQRRAHVEASRWFADHGMPGPALDHAADGGDWQRTAELIDRYGLRLLLSGDAGRLTSTVRRLPDELVTDPVTALVAALAALHDGALASARRHIDLVGRDPAGHVSARLRLLHTTALMCEARLRGDRGPGLLHLIELSDEPVPGEPDLLLLAAVNRGILRIWFRDYEAADEDLRDALRMARRDGRDALALECLSYLAVIGAARGDADTVVRRTGEAIEFAARRGWSATGRMPPVYLLAAGAAFQRLDHAEAARYLSLLGSIDADLEPEVELSTRLMRACLSAADTPNRHEAARVLRRAWPYDDTALLPVSVSFFCLAELQLALAAGDRPAATEVLGRAERLLGESGDVLVLRAVVHAHDGRKAAARAALQPVLGGTLACHLVNLEITAWLLSAHFAAELDEPARAHDALLHALELAAPRQLYREFVAASGRVRSLLIHGKGRFGAYDEFVRALVTAMGGEETGAERTATVSGEALTARELELLRDLPSLLSLEEIADAHVLSVNTVKTHLKAIYRKFEVGSRRQAVDRARELGLL